MHDGVNGGAAFRGRRVKKKLIRAYSENGCQIYQHRQTQLCISRFNMAHMRHRDADFLGKLLLR